MAGNTFNETLRLVFETYGAKTVEKDLNRLKLKVMDTGKFQKKYAGLDKEELQNNLKKVKATEHRKSLLKERNQIAEKYMRIGKDINKMGGMTTKQLKKQLPYYQEAHKQAKSFKGHYLSIMFAGMQLQRMFGGLFKSMVQTYKEFTKDATTPLSESLTRLEANWKFLKFAMMEAATPLLSKLANWLADLANAFAKMEPSKLKYFTYAVGALAGLGGLAFTFGQAGLLVSGLSSAAVNAKTLKALEQLSGMKSAPLESANSLLGNLAKGIGATIAIGAVVTFSWDILANEDDLKSRLISSFGIVMGSTIAGALIGSIIPGAGTLAGAGVGLTAGIAIAIGVSITDFFIEEKPTKEDFITVFNDLFSNWKDFAKLIIDPFGMVTTMRFLIKMDEHIEKKNMDDEAISTGEDFATKYSEGFGQTLTPNMEQVLANVSATGVEAFTVDLKKGVKEFLTDPESGMDAMQKAAEKWNETLKETITKTIKINTTGSGANASINTTIKI
jgi:hypothetical protein